ncbi:rho family-interacting cell polarization regulator 1-like [Achroia grisella]|uniref:rho family-interacting cell polarization regulator 1-like n=1 Tax=Achroia grisella TaxID=688607 RepID=UPI0027D1F91A|nr:rho family-interacting cell polarization regulator 1-like [Achroia grisella]
MADETAVLLNISEMIDLAIGTPEVGVVDFNMLQTVLHCLAQQLRVLGKNVELRGSVVTLPVGRENAKTISISEYVVDTDEPQARRTKKTELAPTAPVALTEQETILVVERVKKSDSPTIRSSPRDRSPDPYISPVYPPPPPGHPTSSEKLSLVTISKFNILENTVQDLKNRVYGSIPKNEAILEEVRSQTNLKAITDMWTSLNVSSRLEAAETGLTKLSSLVQDLIGETTELQDALKRRSSKTSTAAIPAPGAAIPPSADAFSPSVPGALSSTPAPTSSTPAPISSTPAPLTASTQPTTALLPNASKEDLAAIQAHLDRLQGDLDHLTNTFYSTMEDIHAGYTPPPPSSPTSKATPSSPTAEATPSSPTSALPSTPVERRQTRRSFSDMSASLLQRMNDLEKQLKECCDKVGKNDDVVSDQMQSFQDQLEYLMKQVAALTEDLGAGKLSPDLIKDLQGLMHLFTTVQDMQEQLKQVHETALQLAGEKEDRQSNINALLEQIELLKTIKLDREDMVEAMAEKADLRMLARKVSHDQFELACDDLSRGLEHALGKLNIQEALWQQALDDIQREIETKLDKMELSPVKDFFNNKLRQLQENLKQIAAMRREAEAAGTKKKLLRDVNCISCDAKAVMQMEAASALPASKPLPANLSMKPYLSYELDAIRKSQASNLQQRNMHDWETIDKQMTSKPVQKARSETDKHICNRYCGGSHTVTTPAQRVARLGHFIKQWGPDVLPLSSGLAAGDDGRMYKVSTVEGASVGPGGAVEATCTPKSPPRKPELPKPPQKPVPNNTECRCLEGGKDI